MSYRKKPDNIKYKEIEKVSFWRKIFFGENLNIKADRNRKGANLPFFPVFGFMGIVLFLTYIAVFQ